MFVFTGSLFQDMHMPVHTGLEIFISGVLDILDLWCHGNRAGVVDPSLVQFLLNHKVQQEDSEAEEKEGR